jgi:hypothetical protein
MNWFSKHIFISLFQNHFFFAGIHPEATSFTQNRVSPRILQCDCSRLQGKGVRISSCFYSNVYQFTLYNSKQFTVYKRVSLSWSCAFWGHIAGETILRIRVASSLLPPHVPCLGGECE